MFRSETLAAMGHDSNEVADADAGPEALLHGVDESRHAGAVACRTRSTTAGQEVRASGHDRGSGDDDPREPDNEAEHEESCDVCQSFTF